MGKHKQKKNCRGTEKSFLVNEKDFATVEGHMAVRLSNVIVFFGGTLIENKYPAKAPMDEIYVYNIHMEQWTKHVLSKADQAVPGGTQAACTVAIETDIFMHGGVSWRKKNRNRDIYCTTDALWKLSKRKHNDFIWQKIHFREGKKAVPSPRAYHSGWEHEKKMWIFGGKSVSPKRYLSTFGEFQQIKEKNGLYGNFYHCNQLHYFDPQCEQWTNIECTGTVPSPRGDFGCTKIHDSVYIHGGFDLFSLSDFYELNMSTMTWVQFADAPVSRFRHSLTSVTDNRIVLHGGASFQGYDEIHHRDTWILDLHTHKWKEDTKEEHIVREHHTATMADNDHIVIIGGTKEDSSTVSHRHLRHHPKALEQLALCCVCKHQDKLTPKEFQMPRSTYDSFQDMIIYNLLSAEQESPLYLE